MLVRAACLPCLVLACLSGCAETSTDIGGATPREAELAWTASFDAGTVDRMLVDAEGGTVTVTWNAELGVQTLSRLGPDGLPMWALDLEQIQLADLEATREGVVLLAGLSSNTARIGDTLVGATSSPDGPLMVAVDVAFDGTVGRVDLIEPDGGGFFFPSQVDAMARDGRVVAGQLVGTATLGDRAVEDAMVVFTTDADGTPTRVLDLGRPDRITLHDLTVDPISGEVFIIGDFAGVLEIGGAALTDGPSAGGATFLVRLSEALEVQWVTHVHGDGRYEAHPLPGGDVLIEGVPGFDSFPLSLGGTAFAGPLAVRIDAAGAVVDAVSLGADVLGDAFALPPYPYEGEEPEPIELGAVALATDGAVTHAAIARSLREELTDEYGFPQFAVDDRLDIRHRSATGTLETLFTHHFTDRALLTIPTLHPRPDGSVAVVVSTNQPIDFGNGERPPGTHLAVFHPSRFEATP